MMRRVAALVAAVAIHAAGADVIYELVDRQYVKPWYQRFVGGLGRYKRSATHPPFVHIDARGSHARWGR